MDTIMVLEDSAVAAGTGACGNGTRHRSRGLSRLLEEEHGTTAIEMAVVLPTFFLLIYGMISFSLIVFDYGNATYASRAGVRYASLHSSTSLAPATKASVQTFTTPFMVAAPARGVTITTSWTPANSIGSTVSVGVSVVCPVLGYQITVGSAAQRTITR